MSDYKNTLNLPQTAFPMKASLAQREPQRLKRWQEQDLYGQIRQASRTSPMSSRMLTTHTEAASISSGFDEVTANGTMMNLRAVLAISIRFFR